MRLELVDAEREDAVELEQAKIAAAEEARAAAKRDLDGGR